MSIRRVSLGLLVVVSAAVLVFVVGGPRLSSQGASPAPTVIAGRNVNMVSGMTLPGGDPWLQRQNEPSIAVSSRNTLHLLAGANDYRTVDIPLTEGEIPGKQPAASVGDAWLGVFMSYDGGESWTSTLLPGFPQDAGNNPLKGYRAAADPVVRSGPNGLFYYSGIAFNRDTNLGVVFVARFIDDNNKETGGTIRYLDTKIIAKGTASKFLDKPWVSVDQPRFPITNIAIGGQTFPRHNVYIAYSAFSGTTTLLGDVMFARSTDCGTTWGTPIKISAGNYANQGATIVVKPVLGEVLVAWRRFGVAASRVPDTIYVAQSFSRGASFQSQVKVADVTPFDQPTTDETHGLPGTAAGTAFRTNSYPTMTVDKSGHVYLAWSERGRGPSGDARVVLSTSYLGSNWSVPQPVANLDPNGMPLLGHQIMPTLAFAAGKIALAWVDQRQDVSATNYGFNKWIIDCLPVRHTMDIWAAEAETSDFPNLAWKTTQVSRYLYALLKDEFGDIVYKNGQPVVFPVQFNPVNYPLFKGGHNPFNGDYIDIAASPSFRQDTWRNWILNTDDARDPVFHVAWTDNRDVRPPTNGDWTVYTPPSSSQASAYISPGHPGCNPNGSGNEPGMRNQNIYTARLTWGVDVGAPVNDKPLNLAAGIARAFVFYVKNNTDTLRHFRLTIAAQPVGGRTSFDQFSLLTSLDVVIAPYSTIARTVFMSSTDVNATATVNINETDETGAVLPDGLTSAVDINGDTSNPPLAGTEETHNPNIVNADNPNIVNWVVNPNIVNPNIVNPNIVNPNIVNPNIVNPNIVNQNVSNPNIVNPNIVNPNIVNPNIVNQNVSNPNIVNPNIVNPNIVNPNIVNANPEDVTATDVEWTVKNVGSTTTSYSLKTLAKKSPPQGVYVQLLVYRVHLTPAVAGAELKSAGVEACSLKQEPSHELVLNIVNPNIVNPNIVNPNIVNPNIVNADIENATFSVAPGEEVVVDLRVLDSGTSNAESRPQMAFAARTAVASTQALTVDDFIHSLGFAVTSQAVNSADVAAGSTVPPAAATDLVIGTASLPDGVVGHTYNAPLNAYGGQGGYAWSLNSGELPPGLTILAAGAIFGTPTQAGTYQFIIRVDSNGQFDTQQYVINIDSNTTPDLLNITTTSIPNGVRGVWYGTTLQAVGGVWPRSWRLYSGALPDGVSLDSGGVLSGTPTVTGSFNFSARVADHTGTIDTQALTLVVAAEPATYFDITGIVFDEGGSPLGGAVLRGLPNTPVSAPDGTYADKVPAGWSGTAIPFAAGHHFTPASRTYTNISASQMGQNYNTGTTTVSVFVRVELYGAGPLGGVVLNGLPGNPVTSTSGDYMANLPYGWTGTITPALTGYSFLPPSMSFNTITQSGTANFIAALLIGPASKIVFTQSPAGGIGGQVWATQPQVEIQDAAGNRVTSDNSTVVTMTIANNPGGGVLDGDTTIQAVNGVATFADLSIDAGGYGYTLRATTPWAGSPAISAPFGIEGFSRVPGTMPVMRARHTATPIWLGQGESAIDAVLIAGGDDDTFPTSSFDFYFPSTNRFQANENSMTEARTAHTATLLLDGKVLIVGGEPDPDASGSAEVFDPEVGACSAVGGLNIHRVGHRATLLQDGRVLITGSSISDDPRAELFDPATGTFSLTGAMSAARFNHTATLLVNGKVLITGGGESGTDGFILDTAELYDPKTGQFVPIPGRMSGGVRTDHQATLLDNGQVLITGGNGNAVDLRSAEIYDPTSNQFTAIGDMLFAHARHQAVLLRDGTVLVSGGNTGPEQQEIYNPATQTFRATGTMLWSRVGAVGSVLPDGRVLITGGDRLSENWSATDTAEIWNPLAPFPTHVISGTITYNALGVGGVILIGLPGHPMTNAGGYYEGLVLDGWSGIVTPTKPGFAFTPVSSEYAGVVSDMPNGNYEVASAPAFRLSFGQQPGNTAVGTNITPAVTVEIRDEFGNFLGNASNPITLSLSSNPSGATLSGTLTVNAIEGLAVFNDLRIDKVGSGYTLEATSGSLTPIDSTPFNISGGTPAKLVFRQQPTNTMANTTITPAVTVEIQDSLGNLVTSATDTVALSLRPATPGVLGGTKSKAAVAGVATFDDLSIDVPGTSYSLRANSGSLTEVDSASFNITSPVGTHIGIETAADGSGVPVAAQNVPEGSSITVFCISRNAGGVFIENAAVDSWALISKTGGIVDGHLVASGDMKSATFTGNALGSAVIHAAKTGYAPVDSGVLTVVAANGLIAYYPFRRNANDESGYGNNGIINGGAVFAADRFAAANGSLTFDGVDDYVEIPNEGRFDLSQISIVAVLKISDLETSVPVISKGNDYGSFTLDITNSPGLRPYYTYRTSTGNETEPLSGQAVPLNQFFHLVVTYDPATRALCGYVNGVRTVSLTTISTPVLNDQNVTIGLGQFTPPTANRHFVGAIDEIRIYNRVLALAEVQALYNAAGDGDYEFMSKWGGSGTGNGQFAHPFGIAVDSSGAVYVADTDNNRIEKFTSGGDYIGQFGGPGSGDGQFNTPFGIAVDASGNVYVAEYGNARVQKFSPLGAFLTKWGTAGAGDGQFNGPEGIAVDASGYVYVADSANHRVQKFTSQGTFVTKWGANGTEDGQFRNPSGVAVDGSGHVFVTEQSGHRVQKFTSTGTFLAKWGAYGTANGQFDSPVGLAVDNNGYVHVADYGNSRIQRFTSDGAFLTKQGSLGSGDGQFNYCGGIAADGAGHVFVLDTNNARVQKFRMR